MQRFYAHLRNEGVEPQNVIVREKEKDWESVHLAFAAQDPPIKVVFTDDPIWRDECFLADMEFQRAKEELDEIESRPRPPKWDTPEKLKRHCEELRRKLDPSHRDYRITVAHAPTIIRDIWRAMRMIGGREIPAEPPISGDLAPERKALLSFMRGSSELTDLINVREFNYAVDSVLAWCGESVTQTTIDNRRDKMSVAGRNEVFICYAHKDKRWLDDLQTHLMPLLRTGAVTAWSDRQIKPGAKWYAEIKKALSRARVAVFLVTKDFLASEFIHHEELTPLLKAAEQEGLIILWIPVRASFYQESPLKHYQAIIDPAKPLANMRAGRDQAWVEICRAIKEAANPS